MRLQVKAHNGTLNETVRAHAEKRLAKLEKRLYDQTVVEVTLSREHNPSIRDDHSAEAVVYTKGPNIVARESAQTYEAAIDHAERLRAEWDAAGALWPARLVNGQDLQDIGVRPGPRMGELLGRAWEAQLDGEVRTRDEALALVRRLVAEG